MTERVWIRDLSEIDGFAMRAGPHDVFVVISSAVPRLVREVVTEELSRDVRSAPGNLAVVVLYTAPNQQRGSTQTGNTRSRASGVIMAIAATLMAHLYEMEVG